MREDPPRNELLTSDVFCGFWEGRGRGGISAADLGGKKTLGDGQTAENLEAILFVCPSPAVEIMGSIFFPSALSVKNPLFRNFYMQPAPSDEPKEHEPFSRPLVH